MSATPAPGMAPWEVQPSIHLEGERPSDRRVGIPTGLQHGALLRDRGERWRAAASRATRPTRWAPVTRCCQETPPARRPPGWRPSPGWRARPACWMCAMSWAGESSSHPHRGGVGGWSPRPGSGDDLGCSRDALELDAAPLPEVARDELFRAVAGGGVEKHRDVSLAYLGRREGMAQPAARMEVAARRRVDRAGHVAGQDDALAPQRRVGHGIADSSAIVYGCRGSR